MENNNSQSPWQNNNGDGGAPQNPVSENQTVYYNPDSGSYNNPNQGIYGPYRENGIPNGYGQNQNGCNGGLNQNQAAYPVYAGTVNYEERERSFKTALLKLAVFALIVVLNSNFLYFVFYVPAALIVQALGADSSIEARYLVSWLANDLCAYLIPAIAAFLLFRRELREKIPYPRRTNVSPVMNCGLTFFAACFLGSLAGFLANAAAAFLDSLFETGEIPDAMEGTVPPQGEMGSFWIMFFFVAVTAPVFEELIFRRLLLYPLRKHGDWFAIIITALLFGFYHGNFDQMPYAFVVGMLFALLAVNTNSVIPSMVLHVLNNTLVTLSQYLTEVTGETEPALSIANYTSETLALSFWIGIPAVAIMIAGKLFKTANRSVFMPKYQAKLTFTSPAFYLFLVFLALMMIPIGSLLWSLSVPA